MQAPDLELPSPAGGRAVGGLGGGGAASQASDAGSYGGGLSFGDDDPFADDVPQGALELDLPKSHAAHAPRPVSLDPPPGHSMAPSGDVPTQALSDPAVPRVAQAAVNPPPVPQPEDATPHDPAPTSLGAHDAASAPTAPLTLQPRPAAPAPNPAAIIARFPAPPAQVWKAPAYAMKVLWRQFELHQDLASLRRRRSPDVPLYERALKAHDAKMFMLGLVLTCAGVMLASFIFFLPVILRLLRASD